MARLLRRLHYLIRRRRIEAELAEELEAHRAMHQDALQARGMSRQEAAHASHRALGNITLAREDARAIWIWPWVESVRQDAGYALRVVRHTPGFAAAIVLVMSVGIGATTAVFTLIDRLVLRPLPVDRPDRLVYFDKPSFSYPIYQEVRTRGRQLFASLTAWEMTGAHVEWTTELEPAQVLTASGDFYATLGIQPAAGRLFGPDDDRIGGGEQGLVAVLSYGGWQRRFGGDPSAIGRTVRVDRKPYTIVGVTPARFSGVAPGLAPDITVPLLATVDDVEALRSHSSSWIHLLGRLRDGIEAAQADAALQAFWRDVMDVTTPTTMPAERRAIFLGRTTQLRSAKAGYSRVRTQFAEALWMLFALVGLVMLVACASASNLLLARTSARRNELGVRLAIGAGRGRLVRQMLTEATVWTLLATVVAIGIAAWGSAGLVSMMRTHDEPIVIDGSVDWRILAFALALAFVTAIGSAVVPALRATRSGAAVVMKDGTLAESLLRRWSLARLLVTAQVALTVLLLVGSALLVRSLQRVLAEDAGIDRERVLVLTMDPRAAGYRGAGLIAFYDRLLERVLALPGVEAASLSQYPPISNDDGAWTQSIAIDGSAPPADLTRTVHFNVVSAGYFRTVGMRVVQGRDFTSQDTVASTRVVAINESLARQFFGNSNPLGRRMTVGRNKLQRDLEIVAIVSDAKYQRLQETSRSIAYLPAAQLPETMGGRNLFAEIRTGTGSGPLADALRQAVRSLDSRVPVRIGTVSERIDESLVRERVTATLAGALGLTALALACAALYGLLAYTVSRQTYEIALRVALGAERRAIVWMVLRECLLLVTAGTCVGLGVSLALGRYVQTFLYELSPSDPASLAAAAVIMLVIATVAGAIPARRAMRVDPAAALRTN